MDQAHKDVAYMGTIFGFIEQRVLAVKDRPLQSSLADVVIKRGPLPAAARARNPSKASYLVDGLAT